jgi:DNA-binding HxlR family transcriptional regulator
MGADPARARSDPSSSSSSTSEKESRPPPSTSTPLSPVDLDRLIHGRVRLGIVSALSVHEVLTFPELKTLLETSDGNLSVHARRLEDAGYLNCAKSFEDRVPRTEYRLTREGREAFSRYLDHMEALIEQVRE